MPIGLWELNDDAEALSSAASAWTALSAVFSSAADDTATASREALGSWEGNAADAFGVHRTALITDLDAASDIAHDCARILHEAAAAVRGTQGRLESSWASIAHLPYSFGPYNTIVFETETDAENTLANAAIQLAMSERSSLDGDLAGYSGQLGAQKSAWDAIVAHNEGLANGTVAPFPTPTEDTSVGLIMVDGEAILSTGSGDDTVTVTIDPETGEKIVTVTRRQRIGSTEEYEQIPVGSYRLPADSDLTIRGGGGSDVITLPSDTNLGFRVLGGGGDDRVVSGGGDDRIFGLNGDDELITGSGNDYVSGGAGHDYLDGQSGDDHLIGGSGRDTIYGLDGDDKMAGGADADYLEGGTGDDVIFGGRGNDVISGGRGDDHLFGGAGRDLSLGGLGTDQFVGGDGDDQVRDDRHGTSYGNESHTIIDIPDNTDWIDLKGSDEFIARVQTDLDMMYSTESGRALLENLRENHENSGGLFGWGTENLTIEEYVKDSHYDRNNSTASSHLDGGGTVRYLPSIDDFRGAPPVVVLQHELGHVHDYMNDTFRGEAYDGDDPTDHDIKVAERVASGLPIDHDNDPTTPEQIDPDHPLEFTENGLRIELGLPEREHYRGR